VFDIDIERCACGGQLKIIAAIEEPAVIVRILTHLGLPARAPPHSPACSTQRMHAASSESTTTVLRQDRLSRSVRARASGSNCVKMMQLGVMSGPNRCRETEIFTEHRAIDRSKHWRYSAG
jgi:hypothetical protein